MTPIEGETAVAALALCAIAPWVIFLIGRWKVSTAPKPKAAPKPEPATVPLGEIFPSEPAAASLERDRRRSA